MDNNGLSVCHVNNFVCTGKQAQLNYNDTVVSKFQTTDLNKCSFLIIPVKNAIPVQSFLEIPMLILHDKSPHG